MSAPLYHSIHNNTFWLSPQRCIYWEEEKALILSDLHLGKTGHFRKAGIGVPQAAFKEDLQRLFSEIQHYQPLQLIIVGDFCHSCENKELELFIKWRNDLSHIMIHLIKGNHDILKDTWYKEAGIEVSGNRFQVSNFCFTHDITIKDNQLPFTNYSFSGHIHPGIKIKGTGKQALQFPCYYFGAQYAILPAFSKFTGLALIEPKEKDKVFAIVDKTVISINRISGF
jgi:DNA ligase-associated metallophosphoesterase